MARDGFDELPECRKGLKPTREQLVVHIPSGRVVCRSHTRTISGCHRDSTFLVSDLACQEKWVVRPQVLSKVPVKRFNDVGRHENASYPTLVQVRKTPGVGSGTFWNRSQIGHALSLSFQRQGGGGVMPAAASASEVGASRAEAIRARAVSSVMSCGIGNGSP